MSETSTYMKSTGTRIPTTAFLQNLPRPSGSYERTSFVYYEFPQDLEERTLVVETNRFRSMGIELERLLNSLAQILVPQDEEISLHKIIAEYLKPMLPIFPLAPLLQMKIAGMDIPYDVIQFLCKACAIQYLLRTTGIILDIFKKIRHFGLRIEVDPEIEDCKWVCIDITLDAEEEQVLQWYDIFTERFVQEIPADGRELFRIAIDIG